MQDQEVVDCIARSELFTLLNIFEWNRSVSFWRYYHSMLQNKYKKGFRGPLKGRGWVEYLQISWLRRGRNGGWSNPEHTTFGGFLLVLNKHHGVKRSMTSCRMITYQKIWNSGMLQTNKIRVFDVSNFLGPDRGMPQAQVIKQMTNESTENVFCFSDCSGLRSWTATSRSASELQTKQKSRIRFFWFLWLIPGSDQWPPQAAHDRSLRIPLAFLYDTNRRSLPGGVTTKAFLQLWHASADSHSISLAVKHTPTRRQLFQLWSACDELSPILNKKLVF